MPNYIGFSTINANKPQSTNLSAGPDGGTGSTINSLNTGKKFRLVDAPLVIQDFLNALNIQQGEKVGQPGYGTTLWSFIFEPNTADVQFELENEIRRVAAQDPRIIMNSVRAFPQENGILLEVEMAVAPFNQAQMLSIFFSSENYRATVQ